MFPALDVLFLPMLPPVAEAETLQQIIDSYAEIAKQGDPDFAGFSTGRGEKLYHEKGVIPGIGYVSCGSCHLDHPTQKIIANKRECTAEEGDVLVWLSGEK